MKRISLQRFQKYVTRSGGDGKYEPAVHIEKQI